MDVSLLSKDEFDNIIVDILTANGFKIERYLNNIGPDGGRDIEAVTFEYDHALDDLYSLTWWVELKYRGKNKSLGAYDHADLLSKISRAEQKKADRFLLITNTQLTIDLRNDLDAKCEEYKIKIRYWDRTKINTLLKNIKTEHSESDIFGADVTHCSSLLSDRVNESRELISIVLNKFKNVIMLTGAGGVGKSALARFLLYYLSGTKYSFGRIIIDARLSDDIGFQLKAVSVNLYAQGISSPFTSSGNIRMSEKNRMELFFEHIMKYKSVVVIDNFEAVLDGGGKILNPMIQELIENYLSAPMECDSVIFILSKRTVSCFNHSAGFYHKKMEGWDIDFVYDTYLPYLEHLNTSINNIIDTEKGKKELLALLSGNPLALKIANQMCIHSSITSVIGYLKGSDNPAQELLKQFSNELTPEQIHALQCFAQFNRPLKKDEVMSYICSEKILDILIAKNLVESLDIGNTTFQIHPLTQAQFDLGNNLKKRKKIVIEISQKISKKLPLCDKDKIYNHGILRQLCNMYINILDFESAGKILIDIGTRVLSFGDAEYLRNMLERLESSKRLTQLTEVRLMKVWGHLYDFNDRLDIALETYKKMLELSNKIQDPWSKGAALNGLGSYERFHQNYEAAIYNYTESLQIRLNHDLFIDQSNSYHNLGAVYICMKEYDNALDCLLKAQKLREEIGDEFRLSATELYIGECYLNMQEYAKAEEILNKCINMKRELKDVVGEIWATIVMIKFLLSTYTSEKKQICDKLLSWCVDISEQINHKEEFVLSQLLYSIFHLLNEDLSEFIVHLTKAYKAIKDTPKYSFYKNIIDRLQQLKFQEDTRNNMIELIKELKV